MSVGAYGDITYGKTASMLVTLETISVSRRCKNALHTYFMRYRFKHPTQEDFMSTVNEVAGQDLKLVLEPGRLWHPGAGLRGQSRPTPNPLNWWDPNAEREEG